MLGSEGTNERFSTGIAAVAAAVVAAAVLANPARAFGQQVSLPQQSQAEIPEDWAERAGICRRTVPSCEGKSSTATRLATGEEVDVDGQLDESIWARAVWISDFIQARPIEGARPTVRTEVAFAYDETHLYVAGRMYEPDPSQIRANLARRDDNGGSERLKVSIDSYLNRQTSYTFTVTAAGGRADYFTGSDRGMDRDRSYQPIWSADARVTNEGWLAEMAIPFSQLRFNAAEQITFGVNINRYIPSRDEDLFWIAIPEDEEGWASWFGDLEGLNGIETHRPIEFVPYVASNLALTSDELINPDNPFAETSNLDGRIGADLKMGIGSGLTLDATLNPDFGQVEADPAEVNLSAFPTFFDERRPFFVENADLLEANDLFFSRRIGAQPQGGTPGEFSNVPDATTILGAAKLTGRTAGGLSIGALGAVTAEESARFYDLDMNTFGETRVEPATGWLVLRGVQEFATGNNTAGLAFTGVERDLADGEPLAARMNERAYAGGADVHLEFDAGLTSISALVQGSHIAGTEEAIARVQQFSAHYFQRPDADHVDFDPTRTSMTGYRAQVEFERRDGDHWELESSVTATSPEFDINDAGALGRADRIESHIDLQYSENRVGTLRSWNVGLEADGQWNFDGDRQGAGFEIGGDIQLLNFWNLGAEVSFEPGAQSDTKTRGGPSMGTPGEVGAGISVRSPFQDRLNGDVRFGYENDDIGGWAYEIGVDLDYQPGGPWQFSFGPTYQRSVDTRQYVTTLAGGRPETFGERYIFARLDRNTLSAQFRANYAFSPNLSLEGYFEPFAATGSYSDYGELLEPRTTALRFYGTAGTTIDESGGEAPRTITVTDGTDEFTFVREDFKALSFRSNLVMRWEWLPGSTLFLVWQLDRGDFAFDNAPGGVGFDDLLDTPGEPGRNFFAVKATYWLPI